MCSFPFKAREGTSLRGESLGFVREGRREEIERVGRGILEGNGGVWGIAGKHCDAFVVDLWLRLL